MILTYHGSHSLGSQRRPLTQWKDGAGAKREPRSRYVGSKGTHVNHYPISSEAPPVTPS